MNILGGTNVDAAAGNGVWDAMFTFVAPSSGRVVVKGGKGSNAVATVSVSLNTGTTSDTIVMSNTGNQTNHGGVGFTGLTPGSTYTVTCNGSGQPVTLWAEG